MNKAIIFFALLLGLVYSRDVTFNVISFGNKTQLVVNNKKYTIKNSNDEPYFRGILKNSSEEEIQYYYIVDGVKEDFVRKLEPGLTETYNDFFGREHTLKTMEPFHYPHNNWKRSIGRTSLFDDSYIPTIHVTGNVTQKFFEKPSSSSTKLEKFTFYLKDQKITYKNVPATAKNKSFSKFQIKIKLSETSSLHKRYLLKFRNGSEDPTNLRQTIYGNMLEAVGAPAIRSVMVRVYCNKKPVGFYTLQEEAFSDSFLKAEFYGNEEDESINAPSPLGYCYDCSTGSDFEYQPLNMSYYNPFVVKDGESLTPLVMFTQALDILDTNDSKAVAEFEKYWFDFDTFYKSMALQYLTGDWDGYWHFTSNFAFYYDPTESTNTTYRFYFISQDHDETFGVGLHEPLNSVGDAFPVQSYRTMLKDVWHYDEYDAFHRTLADKLIGSSPVLQKRFQDILVEIVQNIFNPVAFNRRLSAMEERYDAEVKWDYSFERPHKKQDNPNWNYDSFKTNLRSPVPGIPWGLLEFVSLRAESIKNELCITWEGDENPPDENCVPYEIPNLPTTTVVEEPTTTVITSVVTDVTTVTDITSTVVETTTVTSEPTTTVVTTETTTTVVETTTASSEPTTTVTTEPTTTTPTPTPTPTHSGKPAIPTGRNRLISWLKDHTPKRN